MVGERKKKDGEGLWVRRNIHPGYESRWELSTGTNVQCEAASHYSLMFSSDILLLIREVDEEENVILMNLGILI